MLPKALKSCPKSNKLPNLVALIVRYLIHQLVVLKVCSYIKLIASFIHTHDGL